MAAENSTLAEVILWGRTIGAVSWDAERGLAHFEYEQAFRQSQIELAPFMMPLSDRIYSFSALSKSSFQGMPGLLADSLPDDFGNALINAWLAEQGRTPESFNPVERLCYMGSRAMGALEYAPARGPKPSKSQQLNIDALVKLASIVLQDKGELATALDNDDPSLPMNEILRVGTSAGGARAKAIIAWNAETNEVRSGQVEALDGFDYWILKFDGVSGNKDRELADAKGYGRIEYAYYLMALGAGINMTESRLLEENARAHFMTRRFDRTADGLKLHMQSLAALEHFDYRQPGAYSYEQALHTIRKLDLGMEAIEQQFRRMAFNIVARNQDDHVKNISFVMDPSGTWQLSPAYDVVYSYNPSGEWTGQHQMSLNGKRDNFTLDDFKACAKNISLQRNRAEEIVMEVQQVVRGWQGYAREAGVSENRALKIHNAHRLDIV
ncbi:MAG: type II toxin-antitoxin system HipA family toxin [Pseudohongiellaceae bacterium]